jgi:hypothetical protein
MTKKTKVACGQELLRQAQDDEKAGGENSAI